MPENTKKSPHFKKENIEKVQAIINSICHNIPKESSKAVDFGCGTGFMIDIINTYFEEVHGVDITEDMMKNIDLTPGNIRLHKCMAENTNFADSTFDFACAYSFMDHLTDYKEFLREVYRVLEKWWDFLFRLKPKQSIYKRNEESGIIQYWQYIRHNEKGNSGSYSQR